MKTAEELWQDFLDQFEDKYNENLGQAIPTRHRGSTQESVRENIVAKLGPLAIIEIRRRQDQGQSDGKIVRDLMNKAAANLTDDDDFDNKMGFGGGEDFTFTFIDANDGSDQTEAMFTGLFTERIAEPKGTIEYRDPDDPGGSGRAPVAGRGTTGGAVDYLQDANDMIRQLGGPGAEGSAIPTKIKDVFLVTSVTNPDINGYYGPNADGALVRQGDRLEDVDVDEVTKYEFGHDLDGKFYRVDEKGNIEVRGTVGGQYGFPDQRTGDWEIGTIRMTERPEEKPIDWITYTDSEGQTWQQDANDPTNRTKISDAQQEIGFSTRFNPATQQYETVRIDVRTGDMITAGGEKGDGFLGQSYDTFADTRDYDQRASQFESSEGRLGRQFNTTDARLRDEFNRTFGLQERQFGEDVRQFDLGFGENVRQFDLGFGEDQRQFNLGFGETQRQFDTTEGRMERTLAANNYFNSLEELGRNYRTFVQTSPQLANAATNQGELIRNILTNGGDVLARTYFTRGGISPLPEITQADLINNLNDEMQKIQTFEQQGIQAENARRARADMERARGEYEQFAEFQRQTPQFTTRQIFDDAGFGAAQTEYQQSLGDMDNEAAAARQAHSDHANSFQAVSQQAADTARKAGADATGIGLAVEAAQTQWQNQLGALAETVNQYDAALSGPTRAQFTETIREQIPVPTFQSWAQSQGPSFAPTPLLNVPNVPMPQRTNQAQLIAQSRATTPPAVASVLSGQMPTPLQFGGLPLPTFQQLQALTPTEQDMLNSRLMTEFNVPLSDVAFQSQRQFGTPSMERNRDLARFRGYAV
jgi:hypothetical protein